MSPDDRQRLFAALTFAVMALFVSSGMAPPRWRRAMRLAAIIGFAAVLAAVLIDIALWWSQLN